MNENGAKRVVLEALEEAVAGIDLGRVDPEKTFHEQFDIDSVDFLNFTTALSRRLGIDISDEDALQLATLSGAVAYLCDRVGDNPDCALR